MPQLSSSQRYKIEALNCLKYGVSEISERTGIPKCTVSRELSRNSKNGRYDACRAEKMRLARRKRGAYKMKGELLGEVDKMLCRQDSPEQISGRMALENRPKVSHETIYRYVYRDKKSGGELYKNLRSGHKKRRKRLGTNDKRGKIPNKTMIAQRPAVVETKERFGDWEGDTIIGGNHQGVVVTLVERKSKHTLMGKSEGKSAAAVHKVVIDLLQSTALPKETITFDNGTEFAHHQQIAEDLGVQVYFANPYHSWERGLNENTNGLIRQFIPKKQNLKELDEKVLQSVQENLNNRPRKSLGFLTPVEFYQAADKKTNSVAFET
jgi:transposase, IS30 family